MSMSNHADESYTVARPRGWPIMHQWWGKLLFMHWPVRPELLRGLIPRRLTIDTFEGNAWIGVVPFTTWGTRPTGLPPVPGLSAFHELNVRTYVYLDGVRGVWFLSLDAASCLAVWGARTFFHLPYFKARMALQQEAPETIVYSSRRTHPHAPPAHFGATWAVGEALPRSQPGSLAFFLTERYCLYSASRNNLYRCRIFHHQWPLHRAELLAYNSTMIESHGLPAPGGAPLLNYAESLEVDIWPLTKV